MASAELCVAMAACLGPANGLRDDEHFATAAHGPRAAESSDALQQGQTAAYASRMTRAHASNNERRAASCVPVSQTDDSTSVTPVALAREAGVHFAEPSPTIAYAEEQPPDDEEPHSEEDEALCDEHGFALQVDARTYARFRSSYRRTRAHQVQHWSALLRESCSGSCLPWFRSDEAVHLAAIGMPPALRPRLWLHFANAERMRAVAGTGSYRRLVELAAQPPAPGRYQWLENLLSAYVSAWHFATATVRRRTPFLWLGQRILRSRWLRWAHRFRWHVRPSAEDESPQALAARQIELDLPRTFPRHKAFAATGASPESPKGSAVSALGEIDAEKGTLIAALRRILLAHALHNPRVGYAQSLNFIGAFLLLQVHHQKSDAAPSNRRQSPRRRGESGGGRASSGESETPSDPTPQGGSSDSIQGPHVGRILGTEVCGEEAAFWLLCALTNTFLPEHYSASMTGVRVDAQVRRGAGPSRGELGRVLAT